MEYLNVNPSSLLKITGNAWVYWKNIRGEYLDCNDLMANDLGFNSTQDIKGKTDADFLLLKKKETMQYREQDKIVLTNRLAYQFQDKATLPEKQLRFMVIKTPVITKDEELVGLIGVSYIVKETSQNHLKRFTKNTGNILSLNNNSVLKFEKMNDFELTHRQKQCLYLLVHGKTAKEIGKRLGLSFRTIENYIEIIKNKLGVQSKSALIEKTLLMC